MVDLILWEPVDGLRAVYVRHYSEYHEACYMQPHWDKNYFVPEVFQAGDGVENADQTQETV